MLRALFTVGCLFFFVIVSVQAGTVSGKIELSEPKKRRGHLRYGGANLENMGPPAPFLGVVYLTPKNSVLVKPSTVPAVMEQRGLQFHPAVLPIFKGSSVMFPNFDNTYHNVFSYSPEKRFDLGRFTKGEEPPVVTFDKTGEVRVFCEVHEHMRAIILVLDTPYFVSTDDSGNFELTDVPAGEYTMHIWRLNHDVETRLVIVGSERVVIE